MFQFSPPSEEGSSKWSRIYLFFYHTKCRPTGAKGSLEDNCFSHIQTAVYNGWSVNLWTSYHRENFGIILHEHHSHSTWWAPLSHIWPIHNRIYHWTIWQDTRVNQQHVEVGDFRIGHKSNNAGANQIWSLVWITNQTVGSLYKNPTVPNIGREFCIVNLPSNKFMAPQGKGVDWKEYGWNTHWFFKFRIIKLLYFPSFF